MLRILTICTGNICRSPLAARLLQLKLSMDRFQVTSAGTSVLVGESCTEETLRVASDLGIVGAEDHRAAVLTSKVLAEADLILGMARVHRHEAAHSHPAAAKRAFTLMEFAQVASHLDDEQLDILMEGQADTEMAAVVAAARMRGVVPRLADRRLYDIEDPYGRSQQVYERSARQIETAVEQIASFFDRASRLRRAFSNITLHSSLTQAGLQLSEHNNGTGQK